MTRSGFYNQNLYRDYPFRSQGNPPERLRSLSSESMISAASYSTEALPHEIIVDFGCIMGLDGNYVDRWDWIYLFRITRDNPYLTFEFRTTANNHALYFIRRIDDPEYRYEWSESRFKKDGPAAPDISSWASEGEWWYGCDAPSYWEGYLVTGKFDELLAMLPHGNAIYFDSGYQIIEPARVQNLKESYVRSFNLANRARTRALDAEQCLTIFDSDGSSLSQNSVAQDVKVYTGGACIQRDVALVEGYNCQIRQEDTTNTIVIGAGVGLGAGEACQEYPFYHSEFKSEGDPYYTGGPACHTILRTLNGVGGTQIRFVAGPGFNVRTSPDDPSTIIVDMTLEDFAICLDPTTPSESAGGP
jgi:hypothetical protein